jgi:hypothetical protein
MIWKTSLVTSLLALSLGLSACVLDRQVKDPESPSDGPTVYGKVSVSVDHVSTQ